MNSFRIPLDFLITHFTAASAYGIIADLPLHNSQLI